MVGVTGSIPVAPTISPNIQSLTRGRRRKRSGVLLDLEAVTRFAGQVRMPIPAIYCRQPGGDPTIAATGVSGSAS